MGRGERSWHGEPRPPVETSPSCGLGHGDAYDIHEQSTPPGFPLTTYQPKGQAVLESLRATLTPTMSKAEVERKLKEKTCLKVIEKRLDMDYFRLQGQHQKGSHYPLCVFTSNRSRRSPDKFKERWARSEKYRPKRHDGASGHWGASSEPQSWQCNDNAWPTGTSSTHSWRGAGEDAWESQHSHSRWH